MEDLTALVARYGQADAQKKQAERTLKELRPVILALMKSENVSTWDTGDYILTYSTRESTSLDEDRVVQILTDLGLTDCLDYVPVPNRDRIADAIEAGRLPPEALAAAYHTAVVEVLTPKRRSG